MKNIVAATLFLTVIFISFPCGCSSRFGGACSSRLMDKLLETCGSHGIKSLRKFFYMYRYKNRAWRHRVGKRSVPEYEPTFDEDQSTFQVERISSSATARLSAIIEAGVSINQRREKHSRVRRQISRDCCVGRCSLAHMRKAYCRRG